MHAEYRGAPALLDALSRVLDEAIVLLDASGGLRFANDRASRLLGFKDPEDARERWSSRRAAFLNQAKSFDVDLGAGRSVRAFAASADDARLLVLRDPGALDRLEHDLMLANGMRVLECERRLLSHDLRAPLNAMHLSLELLVADLGEGAAPPSCERHIGILRGELARLERWLASMLDPETARDPVDVAAAVNEVARLVGAQAKRKRVEVDLAISPPPPGAVMNESIRQALLSVVIDAVEAARAGGRIVIRTAAQGERAAVIVEDTRGEMPEAALREIERLECATRQSGTALYAARRLAEREGGRLLAERLGSGMRFVIDFPLAPSGRSGGICVA